MNIEIRLNHILIILGLAGLLSLSIQFGILAPDGGKLEQAVSIKDEIIGIGGTD